MGPCRNCWNGTTSTFSWRRLFRRGLEFMCVLSIKVPTRKKSENLFSESRIYIYIYIYICLYMTKIRYSNDVSIYI